MARVVVVGAGVGGLAAGVRLARLGHRVTLCEASTVPGGKLGRHEQSTDLGTFRYDTGPTLLTLPHVFAELFDRPLDEVLPLRRLDPIARYRFADGTTVNTTSDLDRQRREFDDAFGPGSGDAWLRLLDRGERIWQAVEGPLFGRALSLRTLPAIGGQLSRPSALRAIAPGRTLRALGRRLLEDPRQRLMLERYATYEGSDPRRAPAALAVVPYLEHRYGAWYVDGGLHRLADALAERFVELGGELRLGTPVDSVGTAGRRVTHVGLSDGGALPADVVVGNVDAHRLQEMRGTARRVPPADSFSGFVLLLGLANPLPELAHHTVTYGQAPYDDEFDAILGPDPRPVDDPVIYANAPDDPSVAPPGCRAVYLLVNAPRHDADRPGPGALDWTAPGLADGYRERVLDLLAGRGIDLRPDLVSCVVRTPADLERLTGAPGGSIYGQVQHGALATVLRPHNRTSTRGLFRVGGSTHPGGGLPLVALSATAVAGAIGPA